MVFTPSILDVSPPPGLAAALLVRLSSMIITLGPVFALTMPFVGVLVRYRANYTPKEGVRLRDGDAQENLTVSYFGMMKRVYRIEGWAGLYKGTMPSLITSLIAAYALVSITLILSLRDTRYFHWNAHLPFYSPISMSIISSALTLIPILLLIPLQIITSRAITTRHRLAAFAPRTALRVLLSPAERAQPLLYLTPGVAFTDLLAAPIGPALELMRRFAAPDLPYQVVAAFPLVFLLAAVAVTSLQVMSARLTLQRRGPEPEPEREPAPEPAPELAPAPSTSASDDVALYTEDVMRFRADAEVAPYTSLLDCAKTIVREEGLGVLFRAWWVTTVLMLLTLLAPTIIVRAIPGSFPQA
ncbi:hypothetical protein DFH09DRAFT_1320891 [Mycena vulgaris]|nr:hypothetical protein DFH09DRAFT_1320891 [Mycena vulgaris]